MLYPGANGQPGKFSQTIKTLIDERLSDQNFQKKRKKTMNKKNKATAKEKAPEKQEEFQPIKRKSRIDLSVEA
jgi:hypothetical protein